MAFQCSLSTQYARHVTSVSQRFSFVVPKGYLIRGWQAIAFVAVRHKLNWHKCLWSDNICTLRLILLLCTISQNGTMGSVNANLWCFAGGVLMSR